MPERRGADEDHRFHLEAKEIIKILKHLDMWSIEYPKSATIEARASPFDMKLMGKLYD